MPSVPIPVTRKLIVAQLLPGVVAFAVGCSHPEQGASVAEADRAVPSTAQQNVVNVYNWSDYIDPAVLERFSAETGIKVNYDLHDSNEILETKLLAGRSGYDVVVPTGAFLGRQIQAGVFQPLDRKKLPNWHNLDPEVMERISQYDRGNRYAVNYMWGTTGIGYDENTVLRIMPDAPVDSWKLLFDPTIASRFKDCGIYIVDAPMEIVPIVLIYLGLDPDSESMADLRRVEQALLAIRPYVRKISAGDGAQSLAGGEACIALTWQGAVLQARDRLAEAGHELVIKYSIPKEGTLLWFDMLAIPKDAPHPENAHRFIDFMQRPEVAAANSNFIRYANGNAAAMEFIDPEVRNDPGIYPSSDVMATLHTQVVHGDEYSRAVNRSWTRFVTGAN